MSIEKMEDYLDKQISIVENDDSLTDEEKRQIIKDLIAEFREFVNSTKAEQ